MCCVSTLDRSVPKVCVFSVAGGKVWNVFSGYEPAFLFSVQFQWFRVLRYLQRQPYLLPRFDLHLRME